MYNTDTNLSNLSNLSNLPTKDNTTKNVIKVVVILLLIGVCIFVFYQIATYFINYFFSDDSKPNNSIYPLCNIDNKYSNCDLHCENPRQMDQDVLTNIGFPKNENSLLHIQIKNEASYKITIWLDDLPFCPKWDNPFAQDGRRWKDINLPAASNKPELNCGMFTNIINYNKRNANCSSSDDLIKGNDWEVVKNLYDKSDKTNTPPKMYKLVYQNNGKWKQLELPHNNYVTLDIGEVLKITPPHKEIYLQKIDDPTCNTYNSQSTTTKCNPNKEDIGYFPYQCNYQKNSSGSITDTWRGAVEVLNPTDYNYSNCGRNVPKIITNDIFTLKNNISNPIPMQTLSPATLKNVKKNNNAWTLNCGGSGLYVTPCLKNFKANDLVDTNGLSRVEYNINGGEIYFNLSGVDGVTSSYQVEFVGEKTLCDNNTTKRVCNLDLTKCPSPLKKKLGAGVSKDITYCPAPKNYDGDTNNMEYTQIGSKKQQKCDYMTNKKTEQEWINLKGNIIIFTNLNEWSSAPGNVYDLVILDTNPTNPKSTKVKTDVSKKNTYKDKNFGSCVSSLPLSAINTERGFAGCPWPDDSENSGTFINFTSIPSTPKGYSGQGIKNGILCKVLCHLWWVGTSNTCAQNWRKFINKKDKDGNYNCQQYAWAYDETIPIPYKGSDTGSDTNFNGKYIFDHNGNPMKKLPVKKSGNWVWEDGSLNTNNNSPLMHCHLSDGKSKAYLKNNAIYVNITFKDVLNIQENLTKKEKQECKQALDSSMGLCVPSTTSDKIKADLSENNPCLLQPSDDPNINWQTLGIPEYKEDGSTMWNLNDKTLNDITTSIMSNQKWVLGQEDINTGIGLPKCESITYPDENLATKSCKYLPPTNCGWGRNTASINQPFDLVKPSDIEYSGCYGITNPSDASDKTWDDGRVHKCGTETLNQCKDASPNDSSGRGQSIKTYCDPKLIDSGFNYLKPSGQTSCKCEVAYGGKSNNSDTCRNDIIPSQTNSVCPPKKPLTWPTNVPYPTINY